MHVIVKEIDRWMFLVDLEMDVIWNYHGSSKGSFIYCFAYHFYFMHVLGIFHFPRHLWGCRSWILFWWNLVVGFKLIASFFISRLFAQLCEVYKSVDFLVVICWDVILMATRRDFEASKERPCCSTVSEPHAHCCTWGYAWGSRDTCWDCWQAHKIQNWWIQDNEGNFVSHSWNDNYCLCFHLRTHHYKNMAKISLPGYSRLMLTAS